MDTTIDNKNKHYKIDTYIKDTIKAKYDLDDKLAEAISLAIDMKDQDLSGYATKGDLQGAKHELKQEIKDLRLEMYKMHIATIVIILTAMSKMLGKW